MDLQAIFGLQFALSLIAFTLILTNFASPALRQMDRRAALLWLTIPHMLRHVGLVFLVPGVVASSMPPDFANGAGYGDLLTGALAILAFTALRGKWRAAIPLTWAFHLVGGIDLAMALPQVGAVPHFGAAWYIPTMVVPLLLVTHALSFRTLLRREANPEESLRRSSSHASTARP